MKITFLGKINLGESLYQLAQAKKYLGRMQKA
jgi:hypothetical protein